VEQKGQKSKSKKTHFFITYQFFLQYAMTTASPRPSPGASYFSTIRGGGTSSSPSSPSLSAATAAAFAVVPPPPLFENSSSPDGITHHNNASSALNSTPYLQSRLVQLRHQSQDLSTELTKKLATSRSGQSLLHIGPSLSTLPPDLTSLLEALSPLVTQVEQYEAENRSELERLVNQGREVQCAMKKRDFSVQCAEIYSDLMGAEEVLRRKQQQQQQQPQEKEQSTASKTKNNDDTNKREGGGYYEDDDDDWSEDEKEEGKFINVFILCIFIFANALIHKTQLYTTTTTTTTEFDHICSLERAAYTTLHLLQELHNSSADVSAMTTTPKKPMKRATHPDGEDTTDGASSNYNSNNNNSNNLPSLSDFSSSHDNALLNGVILEKSRFLAKLAPRIRRLESDTAKCLVSTLEELLVRMRTLMEDDNQGQKYDDDDGDNAVYYNIQQRKSQHDDLLLMIGHCLRGLALLGKGADAESAFARVAVMPIIRSKLSMGKLDEGGSRGECAGLFFLLDDIANTVSTMYGSILRSSESMFTNETTENGSKRSSSTRIEVDLVTCGVWVPVATALMADPGIKMAIFSPGIANVLQANYSALDTFLSELANSLLVQSQGSGDSDVSRDKEEEKTSMETGDFSHLYYRPNIKTDAIERAQARLYAHPTTVEFSKRWNLPIYYQLRFAEFCKRLDKAVEGVCREGWTADVFTGDAKDGTKISDTFGYELPFFLELYDILLSMWKPDVYLRPLTHRFLRGAMQLIGRVLAFVKEGTDGKIQFGGADHPEEVGSETKDPSETIAAIPVYFWSERVEDVAVVAWELTILETCLTHDYLDTIANTVCPNDKESRQSTHNSSSELEEIRSLASDVLMESSQEFSPLVSHSWNRLIVDRLTKQCCIPLTAVKGVAATYRMTNRPPPSQASPFVAAILRPLKEFDATFASRTPPQIGDEWKQQIVGAVSCKYSLAVEDLIATVKRTEDALKSRKTRKMMAGGMSDGEKVKLQLLLDYRQYRNDVEELGLETDSIEGLVKLNQLTLEAESLLSE